MFTYTPTPFYREMKRDLYAEVFKLITQLWRIRIRMQSTLSDLPPSVGTLPPRRARKVHDNRRLRRIAFPDRRIFFVLFAPPPISNTKFQLFVL